MFKYAQLNTDGVCFGIAESSHQLLGDSVVLLGEVESPLWKKYENGVWSEETFEIKNTKFTKLEFRSLFTFEELVAIEVAAETDAAVRVLNQNQALAEFIDMADPRTTAGLQLLVSKGLLTQERYDAINNPGS